MDVKSAIRPAYWSSGIYVAEHQSNFWRFGSEFVATRSHIVLPDRVSARYFPSAFARFPSSYGCGCIGLMNDRFLFKHPLQVPFRVTRTLWHFLQWQWRFQLSSIQSKMLWMVIASVLRLDIVIPLFCLRQDFLKQMLKCCHFVRRQVFC